MVTWREAQEEGQALQKEIAAEAAKYGVLLEVTIEPVVISGGGGGDGSGDGAIVFLDYEKYSDAETAVQALHNRYFAGKRLVATII